MKSANLMAQWGPWRKGSDNTETVEPENRPDLNDQLVICNFSRSYLSADFFPPPFSLFVAFSSFFLGLFLGECFNDTDSSDVSF